jgi:hypothetical protein
MRPMITSERDQAESFLTLNSYSAVIEIYISHIPPNQDRGIQGGQNNGSDRITDIEIF